MTEKLPDQIESIDGRLKILENRFYELGYDMTSLVQSEYKKRWKIKPQSETMFGLFTALCIDTIDPWKQNRVRFFSPLFHRSDTPVKSLPFASPISSAGGFDDCGMCWVPPAGSSLCIVFENGNRQTAFYIGTTWHRDRGPDGQHNWGYNISEYYKIHEGHRKGYLVGANDGSQVFCQWNTENYNGFDIDSIQDFNNDPDAQRKITQPNIYGLKTPQKHMVKFVDGDYNCNHKNKRMEFLSSCGNTMLFKDDHLHNSGNWAHTSCVSGSELDCIDADGNPTEKTECEGEESNSTILGGHPSTPKDTTYGLDSNKGSNPYFKHANECRPYRGVGTPQNNKITLPQSGVQVLSCSGHTWFMDDSVEEPSGIPDWERSLQPFDFGCNNKFLGKIKIISATGHSFEMSDVEEESQLRGEDNYIRLKSATGNSIELNDHTVGKKDCAGCPPNLAGSKRGITLRATSNHTIEMIDEDNEQCSPCRMEGGVPIAKAKKAFIKIRTGYGLEILMKDEDSQEETKEQHIQIFCPQKDNIERGPHIMRFQEKADGPGVVFLRVGGNYICSTYDDHYTVVGDKEKNPSNKMVIVSKNTLISTEEFYFNSAEIHAFMAKKIILLMAGEDCPPKKGDKCQACVWPVLCLSPKGVTISDRVFVSASPDAACANIMQMLPFHECEPFEGCE